MQYKDFWNKFFKSFIIFFYKIKLWKKYKRNIKKFHKIINEIKHKVSSDFKTAIKKYMNEVEGNSDKAKSARLRRKFRERIKLCNTK